MFKTIHFLKGTKGHLAVCGFSHEQGEFTKNKKKITCPQCLRIRLDHDALIEKRSKIRREKAK